MISFTQVLLAAGIATTSVTALPSFQERGAPCAIHANFTAVSQVYNGERLAIIGSIPELGNWDVTRALALSNETYSWAFPAWTGRITLGLESPGFEYKYIKVKADGSVEFEDEYQKIYGNGLGKNRWFQHNGVRCWDSKVLVEYFNNKGPSY